jgi:hypothetical protein
MNEPTIRLEVRPEVSAFVDQVRGRLSDLSDEDREELLGGLEADIAELVADGGSVAELGDPRAYADELRAAAGIERPRGVGSDAASARPARRVRLAAGERIGAGLDTARRRWLELVDVPALRSAWQLVVALRPVWWVARAWVAVELLDLFLGNGRYGIDLVPAFGTPLFGTLLLVMAVVVSVQIGRAKVWPGTRRQSSPWSRLALVGLNSFAAVMLALLVPQLPTQQDVSLSFENGYWSGTGGDVGARGLMQRGTAVQNIFPYDAQGRPLTGVQLFDQDGRAINVARGAGEQWSDSGDRVTVTYPWLNGSRRLYNVFPLPRRTQTEESTAVQVRAWTSANPPALPQPPLAVVPPVALPNDQPTSPSAPSDSENPEGR